MDTLLKRTWAEIDLVVLKQNYRAIAEQLSSGCRMMAVVKADAYGHGAVHVAKALVDAGAAWLGVSNLEEAIQLRRAGLTQPVLILSYTPPAETARLAEYDVTQTVISGDYARRLSLAAKAAGVTLRVHIKLDTGMSRVGFVYAQPERDASALDELEAACRLPHLCAEGIFTHFASADEEDDRYTRQQYACFTDAIERLAARGITFAWRHCCNSAATLRHPEMHLDMVRPGIILYGLTPSEWMQPYLQRLGLKPVMSILSGVSMVKTVPAGTPVSYGRIYQAPKPIRLATVPIGYADGYPRSFSNRAYMLVNGRQAPVVGRVCMDQCLLDVTDIEGVGEDTPVTVMGQDGMSIDAFAALAGTINYEIVCGIGKRVPRVYVQDGCVVAKCNYLLQGE